MTDSPGLTQDLTASPYCTKPLRVGVIKAAGGPLGYEGIPARVVFSGELVVLILFVGSVFCDLHIKAETEAHAVCFVFAAVLS